MDDLELWVNVFLVALGIVFSRELCMYDFLHITCFYGRESLFDSVLVHECFWVQVGSHDFIF